MSGFKTCPKCNTESPQAANFCRKCRYKFPEATKSGLSLRPEIKSLRIRELQYVIGSTIHIEWDADNFTKIELAGEDVTLYNNVELLVEKAVELKLVAINDYDQVEQSLRVLPAPMPKIHRFATSNSNVKAGKKVKLSWSIDGATKVLLKYDTEEIDVSSLAEIEVSPSADTTYAIIAFSVDENITIAKEVAVKVLYEVIINDFSSDLIQTLESLPVELRWDVVNAEKIMLSPNDIDVTRQTSIQVYPSRATTYCLVASNAISVKEQMITIGVRALPRLDIKVSDSLSRLHIPNCGIDLAPLTVSIKETGLDRYMLSPIEQTVSKKIWGRSLLNKLKQILPKRIKV